ncbi:hypothetical protein K501DRAFT_328851 [Backusella circina FSU 941]|nr:hypothetical protein K501DRAFT_328851 [Backusella circina FSU 941]
MSQEGECELLAFDFDDDVFITKEEKERVNVSNIQYQAKIDLDGWFDVKDKDLDSLMLEELGPSELKSSIEHDYLYKRYDRALEHALEYIRIVETNPKCKVKGTREMAEIAIHCADKLGKYDIVERLLDVKNPAQDIGLLLLKSRFYPKVRRYHDALNSQVEYHKLRKLDYRMWLLMAQLFKDTATTDDNNMKIHLAQLSIARSLHIFKSSRWKKQYAFVKHRFENELETLEALSKEIIDKRGNANVFSKWMTTEDKDVKAAGLDMFDWDDIEWIYEDWELRKSNGGGDDEEEDGRRAVKDL